MNECSKPGREEHRAPALAVVAPKLERGVDYIVHHWYVKRLADGAMLWRRKRFITEAGIQKLSYRKFGRLYERHRSTGRIQPPPR